MTKSRFLLVAAGCLLLSSCARPLNTSTSQSTDHQSTSTTAQRDSSSSDTSYKERLRLTKVRVGSDSVDFEAQLEVQPTGQLKPTTYTSRGRRATVQLKVDAQGKLTGRCGCDAEKATIASLDRELSQARNKVQQKASTRYITTTITKTKTVSVPAPYTAWYDWLARVVAVLLLLLLLIMYLIHRFKVKSNE